MKSLNPNGTITVETFGGTGEDTKIGVLHVASNGELTRFATMDCKLRTSDQLLLAWQFAASGDVLEACKGLRAMADLCFDDIKRVGAISHDHAVDYRRYRELAREAIIKAEGKP